MPAQKLKQFLDKNKVKYPGKEMAKTVIVKVDGKMAMAVLPAPQKVDFKLLKDGIGAKSVELATEQEFADSFPECEPGAMPPFGNLYDMDVFVAKLAYKDFEKLVKPKVLTFAHA
jgi:Ala-tRNA(Pro) deacylase